MNRNEMNRNEEKKNTSDFSKSLSLSQNSSSKRFVKPTLEEIRSYCAERKNSVNAENFFDFYESNGWKVGKNQMKDWRASVRTWEKKNYQSNQNSAVQNEKLKVWN